MNSKKQNNYHYWDTMPPPVRPSHDVITIFQKLLKPHSRILLLGSTPELRLISHQKNSQLTVLDLSQEIYDNMSLFLPSDMVKQEVFMKELWQNFDGDEEFDYVIGHGSLNMINADEASALLNKIQEWLKPSGHLIMQAHIYQSSHFSSLEEIMNNWKESCHKAIFTNTWIDLANIFTDATSLQFNYSDWLERLQCLADYKTINKSEFTELTTPLSQHAITIHMFDSKLQESLNKLFHRNKKYIPSDYKNSNLHPVFYCEKK